VALLLARWRPHGSNLLERRFRPIAKSLGGGNLSFVRMADDTPLAEDATLPPLRRYTTWYTPLGQSLLTERDNRVNPGGSQRWEQACEYGNRNQEQRCSR
jgi:hypothetical protein